MAGFNKELGTRNKATEEHGTRRRGDDIAARFVSVGAATVAIACSLPRTGAGRHIEDQLLRAGTAVGAHYEEARAAESPADFVHKVRLATKELREAIYWLRVIRHACLSTNETIGPLLAEMDELVAILIASARTAKSRMT